jgi:hypothetical protein
VPTLNAIGRTDSEQSTMAVLPPPDSASRVGANGDLALDINVTSDTTESIDGSYTGSPVKTKNMSQEDLEMGMSIPSTVTGNPTIWWNKFCSMSKIAGALHNGPLESKETMPTESTSSGRSGWIQGPNVIEDSAIEEKKDEGTLVAQTDQVCASVLLFN